MTSFFSPSINDKYRPSAVSTESMIVRQSIANTHNNFIGHSIFADSWYKSQVQKKFNLYSSVWKTETMFSSSIDDIVNNAAYRSIIELGKDAVPFIIDDLKVTNAHWFYALEALTSVNPIKPENRGNVPLMKEDWIEWSNQNID